jgi:ribose transport system substrate-binding protein
MALGVASAATQARRKLVVTGFDNVAAVQPLLARGSIVATADQHGDKLAVYGIDYALRSLRADTAQPDLETPVDVIPAPQAAGRYPPRAAGQ